MTIAFGTLFLVGLVASTLYFTRNVNESSVSTTGASWAVQRSEADSTLLAVHFVDDNRGWAVGQGGTIIATSDGGETWTRQSSGFELTLRDIEFEDSRTGWIVGHLGLILHTEDGGANWNIQDVDAALGQNLIQIKSTGPGSAWAIAERGSFALKTTDGGENWTREFFDNTLTRSDAFILDDRRAWAAFKSGGVLSTADSGDSWQLHTGVNEVQIGTSGIFFLDDHRGWVAGWRGKQQGISAGVQLVKYLTDGMVAYTNDGGLTWTRVDSDTGRFMWDVAFVNPQEGWAVGSFGQAMHSKDGGLTWTVEPTGSDATLRALTFVDQHTGWAVGENGTILRLSVE